MKRTLLSLLLAFGLVVGLTGCFLPQEEQLPTLPVLTGEEPPEYDYAAVTRGDLIHEEVLSCAVVAQEEENLSYSLTGEKIKTVFVTAGDTVKAGELMCELANDDAQRQIAADTQTLNQAQQELAYAQKNQEICQSAPSLAAQAQTYAAQVQTLEDQIYILQLRLEELNQQIEAGRLYCSIDGIITYAKASGSTSIKNTTVVTVTARAQAEYYTDTIYYDHLPAGTNVELVIDEVAYQAEVTDIQPVPESPRRGSQTVEENPEQRVFLQVTDDRAAAIDTDLKGTLKLLLDSREDVLLLPADAVVYAGGQAMVYQAGENGLMTVADITVGLKVDDQIEITGGLSEGDSVIVD